METAYFNRFTIDMPREAALDCSHQGACDEDVSHWAPKLKITAHNGMPATCDQIRKELKEYGAWDAEELADDEANLHRIVWCAACNIRDEIYESNKNQ